MAGNYAKYSGLGSGVTPSNAVTSLNGLTGALTLIAGSNITITPNSPMAGDITIAATGGGGSGVDTIGALDGGTQSPDGLFISGTTLFAQSATDTFPGLVNNTTQTFSGDKTFDGQLAGNTGNTSPGSSVVSLQLNATMADTLSGGYEGVIVSGDYQSSMAFTSSFNAENNFEATSSISGGIQIFNDQSQFNAGATAGFYSSFAAFPTIAGTVNYSGLTIGPVLTNSTSGQAIISLGVNYNSGFTNSGGTQTFSDQSQFKAGASTNNFESLNINPTIAGTVTTQYAGMSINPNLSGTIADYNGITVNGSGTVSNNATGININMSSVTDSNPQGVVGINSDSRISFNVETILQPSQGFQIGNRLEDLMHIPNGSPVTGTDSLGNNFAGDLSAQDNLADGPTGGLVGWTGTGFISSMAVAVGKTVATANVFAPLAALPDPGYTTGGTITKLSMIKTAAPLAQGGTLAITNLYGFRLDNSVPFASSASNAWGLYIEGSDLNNFIEGNVGIGSNAPTARLMLPPSTTSAGSAPLKIVAGTLMTSTEQGAVESDGTHLYWTDGAGTRQQLDGGSGGFTNPMTTTGDMIYSNPGSTPVRLPIGSNGQVLAVSSGLPTWTTISLPLGAAKVLTYLSTNTAFTVNTPIIFDVVNFDSTSSYNNTTGLFTAPTTGYYLVGTGLGASSANTDIFVMVNGGTTVGVDLFIVGQVIGSDSISGSVLVSLTAGDTVQLSHDNSSSINAGSYFYITQQ